MGTHLCIKSYRKYLTNTKVYYIVKDTKVHKSALGKNMRGEMNMENTMKMYVTADEVAELLGVSRGYAYKLIRALNKELSAKGFRVISGKVPTKYFQEKFYGMVLA